MEAAVGLGVGHQAAALLVVVAALGVVFRACLGEVVVVNEVVTRVVRGIDVDQLHLAGIGFAHDLEGLEVVTLDVEVLGRIPVLGLLGAGAHGLLGGTARLELGLALAGPSELITLARAVNHLAGEVVAKGIEVDGEPDVAVGVRCLGHHVGEERGDLGDVLLREVGGLPADLIHAFSSSLLLGFFFAKGAASSLVDSKVGGHLPNVIRILAAHPFGLKAQGAKGFDVPGANGIARTPLCSKLRILPSKRSHEGQQL